MEEVEEVEEKRGVVETRFWAVVFRCKEGSCWGGGKSKVLKSVVLGQERICSNIETHQEVEPKGKFLTGGLSMINLCRCY